MNVRTEILRLRNTPTLSRLIGELTSQQRLAYNWAVDQLNRQPGLEARTSAKLGHTDTLSSRFGPVQKADPACWWAPRYIHQDGHEKAHLANERFASDRAARLARIAAAEAAGYSPTSSYTETSSSQDRPQFDGQYPSLYPRGVRLWDGAFPRKRAGKPWLVRVKAPE